MPLQPRHDGWNVMRRRAFLQTLEATASVSEAVRAAGMSRASAYALRHRDAAFDMDWLGALRRAVLRLRDEAFELAVTPEEVPVFAKDGSLLHTHRKRNAQLLMFLLRHYDRSVGRDFIALAPPRPQEEDAFAEALAFVKQHEALGAALEQGADGARPAAEEWLGDQQGPRKVQEEAAREQVIAMIREPADDRTDTVTEGPVNNAPAYPNRKARRAAEARARLLTPRPIHTLPCPGEGRGPEPPTAA